MPSAIRTAPKIERRAMRLELKEVDGQKGVFEGYGNVFGVVDWYREIVVKGAFKRTLAHRKQLKKPFVLLWQHDPKQPIGTLDAVEDEKGLFVRATLTLGVRQADEAYLLLQAQAIDSMSIGFDTIKDDYDSETGLRYLKEIRLWEVSLVTFPANEESLVSNVRAADFATNLQQEQAEQDLYELKWTLNCALDDTLRGIIGDADMTPEQKRAMLDTSLAQYHQAMLDWCDKAVSAGLYSDEKGADQTLSFKAGAITITDTVGQLSRSVSFTSAEEKSLGEIRQLYSALLSDGSDEPPATPGAGKSTQPGPGHQGSGDDEIVAGVKSLISEIKASAQAHEEEAFLSQMLTTMQSAT